MAGRKRLIEEKVAAVETALDQINVEAAAREAGVPPSTLRYDMEKVKKELPNTLIDRKRGPKPKGKAVEVAEPESEKKGPKKCPKCGGKATKNGVYWVLNWVLMLMMGWLDVQKVSIQRWRCKVCGHEIVTPEQARQSEAREAWWRQVDRLIAFARFVLGLSVRKTQDLIEFIYARPASIGHIQRLTHRVGKRAEAALARLSKCRQAVAHFLMFDETFPKMSRQASSIFRRCCLGGELRYQKARAE